MIVISSTIVYDPHPIQNIHINIVMGTQKTRSKLLLLGIVIFRTRTIGQTTISLIWRSWSQSLSFHLGKTISSCTKNPFAAFPKSRIHIDKQILIRRNIMIFFRRILNTTVYRLEGVLLDFPCMTPQKRGPLVVKYIWIFFQNTSYKRELLGIINSHEDL